MALNNCEVLELSAVENWENPRRQRRCSRLITYFVFTFTALFLLGGLVSLGLLFGSKLYSKHGGVAAEGEAAAARVAEAALPNAHLTASSNIFVSSEYLPWEYEKGNAYLHLFSYDKEKHALVVPQKGRYSIYLQVTYRMPFNFNCSQGELLRLLQAVYVWSDSYMTDRILMRAKDNVHCCLQPWVRTLPTTGVYSLEAGDRLMVNVSRRNLLDIDEKSLYFGAFLVSRESEA